jgi:hypothetical protein
MKLAKELWYVWLALVVGTAGVAYFLGSKNAIADQPFQFKADNSSIIIVPIQISRENAGIAMIDLNTETLWVYEIASRSSTGAAYNKLKLVAARSWKYDKMLESFNTADPSPEQVKKIVTQMVRQPRPAEANQPARPAQVNEPAISEINEPNAVGTNQE